MQQRSETLWFSRQWAKTAFSLSLFLLSKYTIWFELVAEDRKPSLTKYNFILRHLFIAKSSYFLYLKKYNDSKNHKK